MGGKRIFTLCHFEASAGNDCIGGKCTAGPLLSIREYGQGSLVYGRLVFHLLAVGAMAQGGQVCVS